MNQTTRPITASTWLRDDGAQADAECRHQRCDGDGSEHDEQQLACAQATSTPARGRITIPFANASASVISPKSAPRAVLDRTFARSTRPRLGVKMKVGRIVPCRNSLRDRHDADQRGDESACQPEPEQGSLVFVLRELGRVYREVR